MQTHVGMHAHAREISEGNVGSEAQFFYRAKEGEFRLGLHARVGLRGCLSGSPAGVLSPRCASRPCRLGIASSNSGKIVTLAFFQSLYFPSCFAHRDLFLDLVSK